jgi:hypothetical protein
VIIKDWKNRDWIWLFLIFAIIIILLFIALFCNQENVRNYFSFGASVASILLALVAIIYAFLQSNESSQQNKATQQVLAEMYTKIVEVSLLKDNLSSLKNEINNQSDSIVDSILPEIKNQLGTMRTSVTLDGTERVSKEMETQINKIMTKVELLETQYRRKKSIDHEISSRETYSELRKRLLARNAANPNLGMRSSRIYLKKAEIKTTTLNTTP